MAPPSESFFSIPELVHQLAPYLAPQDLLYLLRTSRLFYSVFTPHFWMDVTIDTHQAFLHIVQSPEACEALHRNFHFTRSLKTKADFLLYYIEGLYAYMDAHPDLVLPHPNYLRRPATTKTSVVTKFVPFPPLTQLVRLDVSTKTGYPATSYTMEDNPTRPSYSPRPLPDLSTTTLDLGLSMCWLISLNPGLTQLTLRNEPLKEQHLSRVFSRTVSRLSHLRQLRFYEASGMPLQSFEMIMLTCPPSLEVIEGFVYGEERLWIYDPCVYDSMELDEEGPLEVRQEPLGNLRRLKLPWNMMGYIPETVLSMLKICPNIEAMDVPLITGEAHGGMRIVAKGFKELCPHIQELSVELIHFDLHGLCILPIMEEIEPNTVQKWSMGWYSDSWKTRTLDVIRRHSETIREIRFPKAYSFKSSTIQGILTTCRALEHLDIGGDVAVRSKLWLDDMEQDTPWVSTRLRYLKLTVDWNDKQDRPTPSKPKQEPTVRMSLGLINDRMNAILASRMRLATPSGQAIPDGHDELAGTMAREANERRRTRLGRFYKQLGKLTNLEVMDLRGTSGFPEEPTNMMRPYTEYALPRLLSLADDDARAALREQGGAKQDRRSKKVGYLSELGGLKKLRELRGSFRIDRPTVKACMGQREFEFMHQHWPELRLIELLPPDYETRENFVVPSHMRWFMEQRPFTKMAIPLQPEAR